MTSPGAAILDLLRFAKKAGWLATLAIKVFERNYCEYVLYYDSNELHSYLHLKTYFLKNFHLKICPPPGAALWHPLKIPPKFSPKSCTQVLKIGLKR
jgi:hypothetical protein